MPFFIRPLLSKAFRFSAAVVLSIVTLAVPVWADFQAGLDAADRGDYATALREWQPLAEQGDADAQYNLGEMYYRGKGVRRDLDQAEVWYHKSATQGYAKAVIAEDFIKSYKTLMAGKKSKETPESTLTEALERSYQESLRSQKETQQIQTATIKEAVDACVAIVRKESNNRIGYQPSQFDAYVKAGGKVAFFGTNKEGFSFGKCMNEKGHPLGD